MSVGRPHAGAAADRAGPDGARPAGCSRAAGRRSRWGLRGGARVRGVDGRGGSPRRSPAAAVGGAAEAATGDPERVPHHPVALSARLEEPLSRGLWLVKWLWRSRMDRPGLPVAGLPRPVARRARRDRDHGPLPAVDLRVQRRCSPLGLARLVLQRFAIGRTSTRRSPSPTDDYPATLDIPYPELSRAAKALLKWWLLAIPHYADPRRDVGGGRRMGAAAAAPRPAWSLAVLVLVAGVVLLFARPLPARRLRLLIGINRWLIASSPTRP